MPGALVQKLKKNRGSGEGDAPRVDNAGKPAHCPDSGQIESADTAARKSVLHGNTRGNAHAKASFHILYSSVRTVHHKAGLQSAGIMPVKA